MRDFAMWGVKKVRMADANFRKEGLHLTDEVLLASDVEARKSIVNKTALVLL
jgi:hypothetical protein